ncbi:MAG TPA: hypothetical protein PK239_10905 [Chitinophagales bacterium]|nr:hypothetical protein [Chitinophagales bacterium]HRK27776.1 hypothetical protein [Chitinophagales bacterium]
MRFVLVFIVLVHGLIHFMGFAKAFDLGQIDQLMRYIGKPTGIVWLLTGLTLLAAAFLLALNHSYWWIPAFIGALVSQALIFSVWQDAKFGTFANFILLLASVTGWGQYNFEKQFRKEAAENINRTHSLPEVILTESDLVALPPPVQRYIRFAGALNKPKVTSMHVVFEGQMRKKGNDFFPFTSEQYNFFDQPTRLFYMKARMFGLWVPGYHRYTNEKASMDIRLFGLIPVVWHDGAVMDKTETVTLFNDMCLLAPATLIDKRIHWESLTDTSARAVFTNGGITISAVLYINEQGQLVDFMSDDRTEINQMEQLTFYTPVHSYTTINGLNVIEQGDAVYQYPDGKFTYGKFTLKKVAYNVQR